MHQAARWWCPSRLLNPSNPVVSENLLRLKPISSRFNLWSDLHKARSHKWSKVKWASAQMNQCCFWLSIVIVYRRQCHSQMNLPNWRLHNCTTGGAQSKLFLNTGFTSNLQSRDTKWLVSLCKILRSQVTPRSVKAKHVFTFESFFVSQICCFVSVYSLREKTGWSTKVHLGLL